EAAVVDGEGLRLGPAVVHGVDGAVEQRHLGAAFRFRLRLPRHQRPGGTPQAGEQAVMEDVTPGSKGHRVSPAMQVAGQDRFEAYFVEPSGARKCLPAGARATYQWHALFSAQPIAEVILSSP